MFCGISVVDGTEWEETKRFNIAEIYKSAGLLTRKFDTKSAARNKDEQNEKTVTEISTTSEASKVI